VTQDFRGLRVWQEARALRNDLFHRVRKLPGEERLRLADQVIRASRSVTANIAEGHGRYGCRDRIRYLRQARGSLHELIDHVDVAEACGYFGAEEARGWIDRINQVIRLCNGFVRYLRNTYRA
jgi:four helix bundle protein